MRRWWAAVLMAGLWAGAVPGAVAGGEAAAPIGADEGVPRVHWEHADRVVGRLARVSGRVVSVGHAGRVHFLNFEAQRPARFTGVIFEDYLERFGKPLEMLYEGKVVEIRGYVSTYAGRPQVYIASPEQIRVLESLPEEVLPPRARPLERREAFTLGTYNVLNLFDAVDDPYAADETTPAKPRAQLERLAARIRALDADVLALQEVESRGYLRRFLDVFLPEMGYEVVHFEGNSLRGIDVCLVSRLPVGRVTSYRHVRFPDAGGRVRRFQRDLLCVTIEPPGGRPFEVWVVHLKSNFDGREYAEPIRVGEARRIRALLDERLKADPAACIAVCGDFNDVWESEAVQTIVGSGPLGMRCFFDAVPEGERITYNREPHRSMIDFILCSPGMAERYVKGSYRIVPGTVEESGSDHNPVVARFRW